MARAVVPERIRDLDKRRAWAKARAPLWFTVGLAIISVFNAMLVVVLLAGAARLTSWANHHRFADAAVWRWLPFAVEGMAALAFVLSLAYLLLHVVSAAPNAILRDIGATHLPDGEATQVRNVVAALAIGLGTTPPELWVVDDPAPNALSVRNRRRKVLAFTTGLNALPRTEIEAVCAHEMAHLHAIDAQWVAAAGASVTRARRYADATTGLGILAIVLFLGGLKVDVFLPSWAAIGVVMVVLGTVTKALLKRMNERIRSEADDLADVAAVHLAGNPYALGTVLDRLATDARRVRRSSWRSELLWFETVEELETGAELEPGAVEGDAVAALVLAAGEAASNRKVHQEIQRRAVAAYATARRERPA
ncbi:MAG: Zn-dependent endoprotease HtpX [Acidimicrobiales bacterium]|nr:Zn-dependent endoprotease HtpX [Acidimicrobiales bacterium]